MSADYLSKVGLSLVRQCETRDPIKIAKQIGVEVMFCENFGPLKGMYRFIKRKRFILLNCDLDERMMRIVCAHEHGHDQLHRALGKGNGLQNLCCTNMTSVPEYEANIVASEIRD
jgi:Zn-dependent peptidase ImmA (M78 family)